MAVAACGSLRYGASTPVSDTPKPVIAFEGVHKFYGEGDTRFHALRGVTFSVRRGEFVAVVGPSGSGKSTVMNLLGCLDTASSGRYVLAGHDVSRLDVSQRAFLRNQVLGFVFQGFNLLPRMSAIENVELPLVYRGMAGAERRRRAVEMLRQVGLGGRLEHTPAELSGGQQQRVAIARALVTDPRVILADEPTGNLDSVATEEVLAFLQRLNRERELTIVMVTHEADVAACASRLISVRDGRIKTDAPVNSPRTADPSTVAAIADLG